MDQAFLDVINNMAKMSLYLSSPSEKILGVPLMISEKAGWRCKEVTKFGWNLYVHFVPPTGSPASGWAFTSKKLGLVLLFSVDPIHHILNPMFKNLKKKVFLPLHETKAESTAVLDKFNSTCKKTGRE